MESLTKYSFFFFFKKRRNIVKREQNIKCYIFIFIPQLFNLYFKNVCMFYFNFYTFKIVFKSHYHPLVNWGGGGGWLWIEAYF